MPVEPVTPLIPVRDLSRERDPIRLLLIDDVAAEAFIFERRLRRDYPGMYEVASALTLEQGLGMLDDRDFDCVLLDHRLPDGFGVASIAQVQAVAAGIPIIILTGVRDGDLEVSALSNGAQDYLAKDGLTSESVHKATMYAIERARLQRELMQAHDDQMALQRQVLSHVSHELQTPVAAIYLAASNLGDGLLGDVTPEQKQATDMIVGNAKQLRRQVNDLLDAARLSEGLVPIEVERVSLTALAAAATQRHELRSQPGEGAVELELGADLPAVMADGARVAQILDNLLSNAAKYAPGTRVRVTVDWDTTDADCVVASVADSGPGIPPEHLEVVFDRMTQLEQSHYHVRRGLGLGLYISRDLAQRMGGRLWAHPTEGGGATFALRLPAHPLDLLLLPRLHAGGGRPVTLIVVEIDLFAGNSVLAGTDFSEGIIDEVAEVLNSQLPPSTVLPGMHPHSIRCVVPGDDAGTVRREVRAVLDGVATLAQAGLHPTIDTRSLEAPRSGKCSTTDHMNEIAQAILDHQGGTA